MYRNGNREELIGTWVIAYLRLKDSTDGYLQCLLVCFSLGFVSLLVDFVANGGEAGADTFTNGVVRVLYLGLVSFVGSATGGF